MKHLIFLILLVFLLQCIQHFECTGNGNKNTKTNTASKRPKPGGVDTDSSNNSNKKQKLSNSKKANAVKLINKFISKNFKLNELKSADFEKIVEISESSYIAKTKISEKTDPTDNSFELIIVVDGETVGTVQVSDFIEIKKDQLVPALKESLTLNEKGLKSTLGIYNRLKNAFARRLQAEYQKAKVDFFDKIYQVRQEKSKNERHWKIEFKPSVDGKLVTNKQIFESLQQFYTILETYKPKIGDKKTIDVKMLIGGHMHNFKVNEASQGELQVKISTAKEGKDDQTVSLDSYPKITKELDSTESVDAIKNTEAKAMISNILINRRAELILESIMEPAANQRNWEIETLKDYEGKEIKINDKVVKVFNEQQIRGALELITITQIAEAVPPSIALKEILLKTETVKEYNKEVRKDKVAKSGRTPGIDKLARSALKILSKTPDYRFKDMFSITTFPSGKGGTEWGRKLLFDLYKNTDALERIELMSDSTGKKDNEE